MRHLTTFKKLCGVANKGLLKGAFVICAIAILILPDFSFAVDLQADSKLMLRARQTADEKDLLPVYDYMSLAATNILDPRLSFYAGAWLRLDLHDKSSDDSTEGELQYAYLNFHSDNNNLVANLGRQFVTEGGISERIDGAYVSSDLPAGFGVAAFGGAPVTTDTDEDGGDIIYGGRLSHSDSRWYTLGVSYLYVGEDGDDFREEEAIDSWIHPISQVDITGLSSYNSITDGWMEHDYLVSVTPLDEISIDVNYTRINYADYFYNMTSNVFSLITLSNPTGTMDSREEMRNIGGSVTYSPTELVSLTAEYKNYDYEIAGSADLYGGKILLSFSSINLSSGASVHRMEGDTDETCYWAYRLFTSYKADKLITTLDFLNMVFDESISGVDNSFVAVASASYNVNSSLKAGCSAEYSESPEFDDEVRGMLYLSYLFGRAE
ncbi:conserved hypothetical protein [Denitrovibrio acetiphilus DSM 12809]|uniref:Uncharacterized protein n=1 Tax=Denitrovibrio acetiphilus (strain DSM 12809 / NBRC 114555 / N2460) TaxID=522772 RepID=D4H667_DENA2|nr:hypothetical protein [Denitrovibrio acetiphilus]ADD67713.1 conserved hypothetical protein [Denitrovibrio acetiphilus DSM 12809]